MTVVLAMSMTGVATAGVSLATISALPTALARPAPCGPDSTSVKRSVGSATPSSVMSTETVCTVCPGWNVTLPLWAVKSAPEVAVSPAVVYANETTWLDGLSSWITNCASPSFSSTRMSLTLAVGVPLVPSLS